MGISIDKFKTAFSSRSSNKEKFERRLSKAKNALAELERAFQSWPFDQLGTPPQMGDVAQLRKQINVQEFEGARNPGNAYQALGPLKRAARDLTQKLIERAAPTVENNSLKEAMAVDQGLSTAIGDIEQVLPVLESVPHPEAATFRKASEQLKQQVAQARKAEQSVRTEDDRNAVTTAKRDLLSRLASLRAEVILGQRTIASRLPENPYGVVINAESAVDASTGVGKKDHPYGAFRDVSDKEQKGETAATGYVPLRYDAEEGGLMPARADTPSNPYGVFMDRKTGSDQPDASGYTPLHRDAEGMLDVAETQSLSATKSAVKADSAVGESPRLKTKALDPHYVGENEKMGWRADHVRNAEGSPPISEEDRERLRNGKSITTKYYSEEEKAAAKLDIDGDGLLVTQAKEKLNDRVGFVMDPQTGQLHTFKEGERTTVNEREAQIEHHSSPLSGGDVAGAGHIKAKDGRIKVIDDASGHYKPQAELTWQVVKELEKNGAKLIDDRIVDAEGKRIDPEEWDAAVAKISQGGERLAELDEKRRALEQQLNPDQPEMSEKIAKQIKTLIEAFEKVTEDMRDAVDLVRGAGAANKPAKVKLQGKVGLTKTEFESVCGDLNAINQLLKKKLGHDNLLDGSVDSKVLNSLPALNIEIGTRTQLVLTTQQFEQTQGNEQQARNKALVTQEIEDRADQRKQEKARAKREGAELKKWGMTVADKLKKLGVPNTKAALVKAGCPANLTHYIESQTPLLERVIFGEVSATEALNELGFKPSPF